MARASSAMQRTNMHLGKDMLLGLSNIILLTTKDLLEEQAFEVDNMFIDPIQGAKYEFIMLI
jgi:hypothetical protein